MKTDCARFALRSFAVLLSLSTAWAGEPVPWADLAKTVGHGKMRSDGREDREYRVVTKAGTGYVGHQIYIGPSGLSFAPSGAMIPRDQVAEIRIHREALLWDALKKPGGEVFDPLCSGGGGDLCLLIGPFVLLLIPVAIGITAAAAPFVLPIEGIKRLLPDRVIKVTP
jgi:hypothetical protein